MLYLHEMTFELMHSYFSGFENDPDIFMDMELFTCYQYDADKVTALYEKRAKDSSRKDFFIMYDDNPIGEICLKHIDFDKKECELSIHMQNNSVKNKGYGTQAERLILAYAFDTLGMDAVLADSVIKNKRSQHVLEKVGFELIDKAGIFKYYRITRTRYKSL